MGIVVAVTLVLCLPLLSVVPWFGDEGVLLLAADRMLGGERLYRDVFEFLPPGGFMLVAGWFAVTETSLLSARLLHLLTTLGITVFTYLTCLRISGRPALSALSVLAWLVMCLDRFPLLSHHWFTTLFCVVTLYLLLRMDYAPGGGRWTAAAAGIAGGAAAMCVPPRGALMLLAGFSAFATKPVRWQQLLIYCIATWAVPAGLLAYLVWHGDLAASVEAVIVFPATRYADIQALPYAAGLQPRNWLLALVFPAAAILVAARIAQDWRSARSDRTLHLCAATALAAFLSFWLSRRDVTYIGYATPLVLPLLLHLTKNLRVPDSAWGRWGGATIASISLAIPVWSWLLYVTLVWQTEPVRTARGEVRLALAESEAGPVLRRLEGLPPDDRVFVYPHLPLLAFLSGRGLAARTSVMIPSYTTPGQYAEACRTVLSGSDWVVVDRRFTTEAWRIVYPAMADPEPPERMAFEAALEQAFSPAADYGPYTLLRRRPNQDVAICDGIAG